MHPALDLQHSIRPGLDILANEIIIALKKRTRFACNTEVYAPGLVYGLPGRSLLRYELGRIERAHAELGRFTYADQEPYTNVEDVPLVIARDSPPSPIRQMRSHVGDRIIEFYTNWVEVGCTPGSDPNTFGEAVTADVTALLAIMERINLGKYVAESKYLAAPEPFHAAGYDRDAILDLILVKSREGQVFELAARLAEHYDFDRDQAVQLFEFMVTVTKDVEVDYIRQRLGLSA
jgi:chorismate mutase